MNKSTQYNENLLPTMFTTTTLYLVFLLWKESLNSDGKAKFHQYQQKYHLSPQTIEHKKNTTCGVGDTGPWLWHTKMWGSNPVPFYVCLTNYKPYLKSEVLNSRSQRNIFPQKSSVYQSIVCKRCPSYVCLITLYPYAHLNIATIDDCQKQFIIQNSIWPSCDIADLSLEHQPSCPKHFYWVIVV